MVCFYPIDIKSAPLLALIASSHQTSIALAHQTILFIDGDIRDKLAYMRNNYPFGSVPTDMPTLRTSTLELRAISYGVHCAQASYNSYNICNGDSPIHHRDAAFISKHEDQQCRYI